MTRIFESIHAQIQVVGIDLMGRKKRNVLAGLVEAVEEGTVRSDGPRRVIADTGPKKHGYRVVANLRRRKCPRCGCIHFSSWATDHCVECFVIGDAEKKAGRPLTKEEARKAIRDTGLD